MTEKSGRILYSYKITICIAFFLCISLSAHLWLYMSDNVVNHTTKRYTHEGNMKTEIDSAEYSRLGVEGDKNIARFTVDLLGYPSILHKNQVIIGLNNDINFASQYKEFRFFIYKNENVLLNYSEYVTFNDEYMAVNAGETNNKIRCLYRIYYEDYQ